MKTNWRLIGLIMGMLMVLAGSCLIAGCGSEQSGIASKAGVSQGISPTVVRGWASKWCRVQPGMDANEARKVMGPPTGVQTGAEGGDPNLAWEGFDYQFLAFLDIDGKIKSLQDNPVGRPGINSDSGPVYNNAEAAIDPATGCPWTRFA